MKTFLFPGQGSQKKGMCAELFDQFPELVSQADQLLGYSLRTLCLDDPDQQLNQTQFTQPALFVVSALSFLAEQAKSDFVAGHFVAGHSLGEYSALFAAGVIDFETGIKLVQKRGELMSQSRGGAMTAVVGWKQTQLEDFLATNGWSNVTIANYNSPRQYVLSGDETQIRQANTLIEHQGAMVVALKVSGAFHSKLMAQAQAEYGRFIGQFEFKPAKIPVLSNVTALPYQLDQFANLLTQQLTQPVRWQDCIHYLMDQGVNEFVEVGPGKVLSGLNRKIKREYKSTFQSKPQEALEKPVTKPVTTTGISALSLGSSDFKTRYQLDYSYCAGAMYKGIASKELVGAMAKQKMLAFLGTGGQQLSDIEADITWLLAQPEVGNRFGVNLLCQMDTPEKEMDQVALYLRHNINKIEAAAFYEVRPSLVWFRLTGVKKVNGQLIVPNQLMAKISRPELAQQFFAPAPKAMVDKLVLEGRLTAQEAELAGQLPLASDVCCEADSGGHTDRRAAMPVFTGMLALRDQVMAQYSAQYDSRHAAVALGLAGGLGTPDAIAAAFMLGADFVTTGSINQCTIEAGTSDLAKDMLQNMGIQDTTYAPAGDMFELGVTIQVLKKANLFASRGNKLWQLYQSYQVIEQIPAEVVQHLEQKVFRCSVDEVWQQTKTYYQQNYPQLLSKAEHNPKYRMALIFKWYFVQSTRYASAGLASQKANFQIHTGPALGAFNQWAKGSELEPWRNRSVATVALKLMNDAAAIMTVRFNALIKGNTDV